jgi:hypothetical protein
VHAYLVDQLFGFGQAFPRLKQGEVGLARDDLQKFLNAVCASPTSHDLFPDCGGYLTT